MRSRVPALGSMAILLITGCQSTPITPPAAPRQFIVAIDRSASRSQGLVNDEQRFLKQLASQVDFGDQFVLMRVQADGLRDQPQTYTVQIPAQSNSSYPTLRDKQRLIAAKATASSAIDEYLTSNAQGPIKHTDILTSLHLASQKIQTSNGLPVTLLLLSDMMQSDGAIEMEHAARMPAPGWLPKQESLGLIPSFRGACVVVIGADTTNAAGVQIKRFWQGYFRSAGTALLDRNYQVLAPQAKRDLCR